MQETSAPLTRQASWSPLVACAATVAICQALGGYAVANNTPGTIVFSTRQWEGVYHTSDIPGGVQTTPFTSAIYTVPADGSGQPRKVADVGGRGDYPRYSPDCQWIYFQALTDHGGAIFRCHEDGSALAEITAHQEGRGDRYGLRLSRDGTRVLYVFHDGQAGRVGIMNPDGSDPRLIAPDIGYHYMADISPDNKSVVFAQTAKGYVLALKRLDTGEFVTLTPDLPESYCPQFTPDGKTIVFFRRDGEVYRISADGTGLKRLTTGRNYVEFRLSPQDEHGSSDPPAISPDGSKIATIARRDGVPQVFTMNLDGSDQRQITFRKTACGRVEWSPDGKRLAFVSWEGDYTQLFVVPAEGGTPRKLTDIHGAVYFLAWKPHAATTGGAH